MNASTGDILAVDSANSGGFDEAIDGGFPPGSTFKVITSTALITHGLTPRSAASCPSTATVDGEVFHNAEGDAPVSTLLQAFTESCNTAFIQLATGHLTAPDLPAAATMLGVGRSLDLGLISFDGSVPQPADKADLAATSIGQGRVLMSPLSMAMVAAAADAGTVRTPQLIQSASGSGAATSSGSASSPAASSAATSSAAASGASASGAAASSGSASGAATPATSQLPANVVSDLHTMMASVVASGTAAGQGLPAWHLRQDRDRPVRVVRPAEDRRLADGLQWHYRVRVPGGGFHRGRRAYLRPDRSHVPRRPRLNWPRLKRPRLKQPRLKRPQLAPASQASTSACQRRLSSSAAKVASKELRASTASAASS